jgi:hypothetical protein
MELTLKIDSEVLSRLNTYLASLKKDWDESHPDKKSWLSVRKTYVIDSTIFLISVLDNLIVFVQDNNDNIWMVGRMDGAEVTAMTTATGVAKGDLNGYTITFTAEEAHKAYRLESFTDFPFDNFDVTVVNPTI